MTNRKQALIAVSVVAVLLFGALAVIPNASAQGGAAPPPTFTIKVKNAPTAPLKPVEDSGQIQVEYTYSLSQPVQNTFGVTTTVTIEIEMVCNQCVSVTGDTNEVLAIPAGGASGFTKTSTITKFVTINRAAKALDEIPCTITGNAKSSNIQQIPNGAEQTTTTSIKPDYFGVIEAKSVGNKLQQGGPQKQIPFALEVKNFGNGETKVRFQVVERPGNERWQALPPDQMILDQKDGANANGQTTFTVSTPYKNGWNNEEGAFLLRLIPEYNFDSEKKGGEVDIQLLARVRGVYVPSLEPMVMVGAVIGSAMMARLMRKDE